jgi:DNA-binding SARP family transcriptional activator
MQELLSYVLLFHERPHRREVLADALWPESLGSTSLKKLRQVVWQLQGILESVGWRTLLEIDQDWIEIQAAPNVRVDVRELEAAYDLVRGVRSEALGDEQIADLRAAVVTYRGDLLECSYGDWCVLERERLKSAYLVILDKLLVWSGSRGRWEDALLYGGRILRYDRAHERTHRQMMRMHYLCGDRTAALRQFEACERALETELGVVPGQQTIELYENIRADRALESDLGSGVRSRQLHAGRVLSHLRQVKRTLAYTANLVAGDIAEIEATIEAPPKAE